MGGNGTFAKGNNVAYTYKTVGKIEGVKVLQGLNGKHNLPEEAHSSFSYIMLYPDGNFRIYREYDENHYLKYEIAYHPEPSLNNGSREPILHVHEYPIPGNFNIRPKRPIQRDEYEKYKKYFKGVPEYDKW